MKKQILSLSLMSFLAIGLFAQQSSQVDARSTRNLASYRNGLAINETRTPANFKASPSQVQFTNDVIINNSPAVNQRNVKIVSSVPGWLFAAYTTLDATNGGVSIDRSKDGGVTWQSFGGGSWAGMVYDAIDISVAGADTNNLVVFLAGVLNNGGNYVAWVDSYNGLTGAWLNENFNETATSGLIYDIVIDNDFLNPSVASFPYSVAVAYSASYALQDSLIYSVSTDGGANYGNRQCVIGTGSYLRKISLAYARSASYTNGRYMIAYELRGGSGLDMGNIGYVHNSIDPTSTFSTPLYLDSIQPALIGRCRYPTIGAQNDNTFNDSTFLSSIITFDRLYVANDWDVLSFASEKTINTTLSNWHQLDIDNSGTNVSQGNVTFKTSNQNFAVTYYDSTNQRLNVVTGSYNMLSPSFAWTNVFTGYNDLSTNLLSPKPQIAFNANNSSLELVWNSEGASSNGVALFDQELLGVGVPVISASYNFSNPYPNPSNGIVNFNFNLNEMKTVQLNIVDMLGKNVIETMDLGILPTGEQSVKADLSGLANGVYIYQMMIGTEMVTGRITVAHQ